MSGSEAVDRPPFLWSMTLRDVLVLVLIADLIFLGKTFVRVPLHVPGHSGVLWIALLVVGRGIVDKRGAGVVMGLIAGLLVMAFGFGKEGLFEWTKYASAGLILDLSTAALGGNLRSYAVAALVGAAAHLAKLVTMTIVGLLLGLPVSVLAFALGLTATTHVAFGALGGVLGAFVLRELDQVPHLRGHR